MTQIMNLLHLAPDIQEQILFLSPAVSGCPAVERQFRGILAVSDWDKQRTRYTEMSLLRACSPASP
jgi:hypothetical protein